MKIICKANISNEIKIKAKTIFPHPSINVNTKEINNIFNDLKFDLGQTLHKNRLILSKR